MHVWVGHYDVIINMFTSAVKKLVNYLFHLVKSFYGCLSVNHVLFLLIRDAVFWWSENLISYLLIQIGCLKKGKLLEYPIVRIWMDWFSTNAWFSFVADSRRVPLSVFCWWAKSFVYLK